MSEMPDLCYLQKPRMLANLPVQSSTPTLIHNTILFIDTRTILDTKSLIH